MRSPKGIAAGCIHARPACLTCDFSLLQSCALQDVYLDAAAGSCMHPCGHHSSSSVVCLLLFVCLQAAAAAEALRAIFPSVQSSGVDMVIPMPGHPPANAKVEATMQQVPNSSIMTAKHTSSTHMFFGVARVATGAAMWKVV